MSIYDYSVKTMDGGQKSLRDYEGRVLLIINSATGCGFTPQYDGLEKLYEKYQNNGLEILDFPSNQFANQAPGTNEEIHNYCELNFGVSFPQFSKIDVNGPNEDPLYTYLKSVKSGLGSAIKWNFTKFLVDRKGNVIKRYAPVTTPESIEKDIVKLLTK
ncbi:MAG: glutathione peroxidase [Bacteroidia bacterium]|nr:glutathione peroxidase [Bacteroidia bacterium]